MILCRIINQYDTQIKNFEIVLNIFQFIREGRNIITPEIEVLQLFQFAYLRRQHGKFILINVEYHQI